MPKGSPRSYFVYAHLPPEGGCRVYAAWGKHGQPQGSKREHFYDTLPASIRGGKWVAAYSAGTAKDAAKRIHGISCSRGLSGARKRRRR
jgi:hypothetical protein